MHMAQLTARVKVAQETGVITMELAHLIYNELAKTTYYGNKATNTTRDRMLTNRFGI